MGAVRAAISPKPDVLSTKVKDFSVDALSFQTSKESSPATDLQEMNGAKSTSLGVQDRDNPQLSSSEISDSTVCATENGHMGGVDVIKGSGMLDGSGETSMEEDVGIEASGVDDPAGIVGHIESETSGGRGILGSKPEGSSEESPGLVVTTREDVKASDDAAKRPERRVFRGPRPDFGVELRAIRDAQMIVKEKRDQQELITAALRLKQARRAEAQEQLRSLRATLRSCNEDLRNKYKELEPIQASLSSLQEKGRAARSKGRDLPCSTEEELDAMIAELEYRQMHETMQISEERDLVRKIKKLRGSRDEVRANVALMSEFSDTEGQREALQTRMKAMLQVIEALKRQREAAKKIVDEYEVEAETLSAAVKDLMGDRSKAVADHQAAYEVLQAARAALAERKRQYENGELPSSFRRKTLEEDVMALMESTGSGSTVLAPVSSNKLHLEKLEKGAAGERTNGKMEDSTAMPGEPMVPGTKSAPQVEEKSAVEKTWSSSTSAHREKTSKKPAPPPIIERADNLLLPTLSSGGSDTTCEQAQAGGETTAQLKEKRRLEALQKQKEAEVRKRRQNERAEARAKARAEKEAEEAAKRREKEKERKAQKKTGAMKCSDGDVTVDEMIAVAPEQVEGTAAGNKTASHKTSAKKDDSVLAKKASSIAKNGKKIVMKPTGRRDVWTRLCDRTAQYYIAVISVVIFIVLLLYMVQTTGA